ncbi:hypothetical protein OF364_01760 [Mycoplasma enhydrae]|uniref:MHO_4530 family protein n=1 Tax=Mycoplasma enhydrae TaxID=2499220 RepID=UPI00197C81B0|nr:hypothetical protein [Mycoplasma enhydrae]MBN4089622.1 hypothetical protein [Mycoplasma enhydrae]MCV3733784.1 hypothetical protein [Mycoplasma enhydrae]MCV3753539.1 hypothetical protein [Mycoplasma enhydrae]
MSPNSIKIILVVFILLAAFSTVGFIGFFAYRRRTKTSSDNGFMCFLIDTNKERIKANNSIREVWTQPAFLKKISFIHNKWRKLQDFLDLFDRKSKSTLSIAIKNKNLIKVSTEISNSKSRFLSTKVNITFDTIQDEYIFLTLNWYENDSREDKVFEATNTNIDYLIDKNNQYFAYGFILNIKDIENIANFIALFKANCVKKRMYNIKVFLDWNKLFFVMPFNKISESQAMRYIKYFSKWSIPYKHLYNKTFSFKHTLLKDQDFVSYQTLFDYVKSNNLELKNDFLLTYKIYEDYNFLVFKEKYDYVLSEINNSHSASFETHNILSFGDKKWKIDTMDLDEKFEVLNIDSSDTLANLDIYKNFYLKIFSEPKGFKLNGKLININDFVFNLIENKKIEDLLAKYKSFIQLIIPNSKKNTIKVKKKIELIQQEYPEAGVGLRIININNDLVSIIDKWIKVIWVDENLVNNLHKPEAILYISMLYKKAEQHKISIIFDKLDFKNYRKILQNENLNLFFTK